MLAQCSPGVSVSLSKEAPLPRKGVPLTWKYQKQFAHAYINHLGTRHCCTRNTALCCQAVTNGVTVHSQNWRQPDLYPGCVHPLRGLISCTTPKGSIPCPQRQLWTPLHPFTCLQVEKLTSLTLFSITAYCLEHSEELRDQAEPLQSLQCLQPSDTGTPYPRTSSLIQKTRCSCHVTTVLWSGAGGRQNLGWQPVARWDWSEALRLLFINFYSGVLAE